jgi:hypothetical protein
LRLDVHRNRGAPELAPFDIDLVVVEAQGHSWAKDIRVSRASQGHLEIKS